MTAPAAPSTPGRSRCDRCAAADMGRDAFKAETFESPWDDGIRLCAACLKAGRELIDRAGDESPRIHTGHPHFLWIADKAGLAAQLAHLATPAAPVPPGAALGASERPVLAVPGGAP